MKVITTVAALQQELSRLRQENPSARVGLVPTMGALHAGHLSLVAAARKQYDIVVVSVFVNPTQFNNPEDLRTYPRKPEEDLARLRDAQVDVAFLPTVEEMYPEADTRQFDFGFLGETMEGAHRPGHFNGVAQIVSKLFMLVQPDGAFFGEKDFQQIAIVREMVRQLALPVEIHSCPIIREADGLALSSRNLLLTSEQRDVAPRIHDTLVASQALIPEHSPREVVDFVVSRLAEHPLLRPEYYQIVDGKTLRPLESWSDSSDPVGCIVCYCGEVRLIDNIHYKTSAN